MSTRTAAALAIAVVAIHACRRPAVPDGGAPAIRAETLATVPVVEMHCSDLKPGVEVATVRVRPTRLPPLEARVEATVFKDGFTTNRFATFRVAGLSARAAIDVHPTAERHARAAFAFDSTHVSVRNDSLVVRVENLEPGLTYHWRFVERSGNTLLFTRAAMVHAPTCHGDAP